MVEPNSGSNNHIVHMLEEGLMEAHHHPLGLIHEHSSHRTVMALWTEVQTGGLHLDTANNRLWPNSCCSPYCVVSRGSLGK
jgi:hypothetical protein